MALFNEAHVVYICRVFLRLHVHVYASGPVEETLLKRSFENHAHGANPT